MDKSTKKFTKAVAALKEEALLPTPDAGKVTKILGKLRKCLKAGADPSWEAFCDLRDIWEEAAITAESTEEVKDIAFTVAGLQPENILRILEAESASENPDDGVLGCNYFRLRDLTCDCGEEATHEDDGSARTPFVITLTAEQAVRFRNLPEPASEPAAGDYLEINRRTVNNELLGLGSRKF